MSDTPTPDSDNGSATVTVQSDPLLDAERAVHELAEELGRMRSAAVLLEASQQKVDALLRASDAIVQSAGRFTDDSVAILQRLQAIDLESRLGEVNRKSAETQELLGRQLDRLNEALAQLRERSQQDAGSLKDEVVGTLQTAFGQLQQGLQKRDEAAQRALTKTSQEASDLRAEVGRLRALTLGLGGASVVLLLVVLAVLFLR